MRACGPSLVPAQQQPLSLHQQVDPGTPPMLAHAETRKFLGAVVVIAANAGGAWTPIGDVTTTLLWVGGQITTWPTMQELVLPSMVSLAVPMAAMSVLSAEVQGDLAPEDESSKGNVSVQQVKGHRLWILVGKSSPWTELASMPLVVLPNCAPLLAQAMLAPRGKLVLGLGLGTLLMVPVFKSITGLPPYLGMLAGGSVVHPKAPFVKVPTCCLQGC